MTIFLNNEALLRAFRQGDESAFREVYLYYIKDIELFIARGWFDTKTKMRVGRIRDFDTQAELIQDIFLRAFLKNARIAYDGVRPYKHFLLTLARNVLIDFFKKRNRDAAAYVNLEEIEFGERLERIKFESDEKSSDESAAMEDLIWRRCVEETAHYSETLDTASREFIRFRFQNELPLLDVARRLSISRGKARQMEKELGKKLRKHLLQAQIPLPFKI